MDTENNMMYWFFKMCLNNNFLKILKSFTQGIGCGLGETMLVFADDPDENDPRQEREFPELENFEGVGFFCEHYPEPLLVSYQVFYDNLKNVVAEYLKDKDKEHKTKAQKYLSEIKNRYNLS